MAELRRHKVEFPKGRDLNESQLLFRKYKGSQE